MRRRSCDATLEARVDYEQTTWLAEFSTPLQWILKSTPTCAMTLPPPHLSDKYGLNSVNRAEVSVESN